VAFNQPGAVRFEAWEAELLDEAWVIELTGWSHEAYMEAPLALVDMIKQRAGAKNDYQAWVMKRKK